MKNILTFIAGLAIGAGVSWTYHKNKYEEMVQDEVEELRNHMNKKKEDTDPTEKNEEPTSEKSNYVKDEKETNEEYKEFLHKNRYVQDEENNTITKDTTPYVVTPEDFASIPGYDTDTFYYHKDDIITNDMNEVVDNVEQILGLGTMEIRDQFGVYEDDAVYIRNMSMKCDYEILKDEENYKKGLVIND